MTLIYRFTFIFIFLTSGYAVEPSLFDSRTMMDPLSFTVAIKNVGQGSCTIIRNHENNHFLIIDAGSLSDKPKNTEERIAEEFGFSELNDDVPLVENTIVVVVSHSDKDHINLFKTAFGFNYLLLKRVNRIYVADHFENYFRVPETREFLSGFVKKVPKIEDKLVSLSHDLSGLDISVHLDKSAFSVSQDKYYAFRERTRVDSFFTRRQLQNPSNEFEVIGANAGAHTAQETDTNTNSAVVRLSMSGSNIIVMGDATGVTTEKILDNISDSTLLKAELLIAGHHGAENEDTNHITWAAVTEPKRVVLSSGFNKGYKHPTLTAVAHYLATGLESDRIYPDSIWGEEFGQNDLHELSIYNSIGRHVNTLRPHIKGLEWFKLDYIHEGWGLFQTRKPIYSTGSSGELRYAYSDQGKLIHFWKER